MKRRPIASTLSLGIAALLAFGGVLPPGNAASASGLSPQRFVTDQGMIVLLQEAHSLPVVHVQVIVKAGAVLDPPDQSGLAHLTAVLLDEGTETLSSTQIAEKVDFMGARLSTSGGDDYATASLQILKKDLTTGLELLSDILRRPAFADEEIQRKRLEILGGLRAEKDQPDVVADKAFNEIIFGAHPYRRPTEGTEESLPAISRADVVRFHESYYHANNTILTVVGDVTESETRQLLDRFFGDWKSAPLPKPDIPAASGLSKSIVKRIDKDLTQANIVIGHLGIDRHNPDYYAVTVMNYILGGGGFSSRLMGNLRDNQGLAYSIYSHFNAAAYPGSFSVTLQTKNTTAQKAIEGVLAEIRRIRTAPVLDRELDEAKAFLIGSFPLRMDTSSKIAGLLSQVEFHDLGSDYLTRYPKLIDSVSKSDIQRVAQKYLDPDRVALVVVANLEEAQIPENLP